MRKGEVSTTTSKLELQEDGKWKATMMFQQSITLDGVNWEDKETSCVAFGTDKKTALGEASFVLLAYLQEHNYDLFTGGLDVKDNSQ